MKATPNTEKTLNWLIKQCCLYQWILNLGCTEEAMKYTNTFGPFQPGCIKSLWVGSGILYQSSPSGTKVQPRLISTALTSLCLNFLT